MLYLPNTTVTISTTVSGTPAAAGSERKGKRNRLDRWTDRRAHDEHLLAESKGKTRYY